MVEQPTRDERPKTAARLLREAAAADPDAHDRALARGYDGSAERRPCVTPGHPVRDGAGYDCGCGQCLYVRQEMDREAGHVG